MLSVAGAWGPFIVALTIAPPQLGPADVRVQVLGSDAGDQLTNARFAAKSGAAAVATPLAGSCGHACFEGRTSFAQAGQWQFRIDIDSTRGAVSVALSAPLPTPDGSASLARTRAAMNALRTAVVTERLAGEVGGPIHISVYRFEAPDKGEVEFTGATTILAGRDDYERTGSGPWQKTTFPPAAAFSWPSGYYQELWGTPIEATVLGGDIVGGSATDVIAFLRPDVPAWFRLLARRSDGLVVRQDMLAEGHIMTHTYSELNGPVTVVVPP